MYGLEFRESSNELLGGSAEFEVRTVDSQGRQQFHHYKIVFGPDGMWLYKPAQNGKDVWEPIIAAVEDADIEAILPKRSDFGMDWTFQQFMLALTFYGEGHNRGYIQGEMKGQEIERNRAKYEARNS